MDLPSRYKAKNKKTAQNTKPKSTKKRKSDGPTCSMFLAELTRKLRRQDAAEETSKNIVQTIIESITNALPLKFSKKSPPRAPSPTKIEILQSFAPELTSRDKYNITVVTDHPEDAISEEIENTEISSPFKMPKMPLVNSDVFKRAILEGKKNTPKQDQAVNTSVEHDVASEIRKHVGTLRKISLIAEEFNQKTAKNLKEIIDSVQEDLIKKLEEAQAEKTISNANTNITEIQEELEKEPISLAKSIS